jgi:hypothetical protein
LTWQTAVCSATPAWVRAKKLPVSFTLLAKKISRIDRRFAAFARLKNKKSAR